MIPSALLCLPFQQLDPTQEIKKVISMNEKINYWIEIAEYDLETARVMLEGRRFLYVGFMCHQVIEKVMYIFITLHYRIHTI